MARISLLVQIQQNIATKLGLKTMSTDSFKNFRAHLATQLSLGCLLILFGLVGVCFNWVVQIAPHQTLRSDLNLEAHPGQDLQISLPIVTEYPKGSYTAWITGPIGSYATPDTYLVTEIGSRNITIPKTVVAGTYNLHYEIEYKVNPFTTGTISMSLGNLVVKN
jgi:hypothetical protein